MELAGSILTRYKKAESEFMGLAGVDADPARMGTVADLVFIAQFELDLAAEGESTLTGSELDKIRRFVKRYGPAKVFADADNNGRGACVYPPAKALLVLTLAVLLGALAAHAQDTTKCTTLRFEHTTLCTFADGGGLETDYDGTTWTDAYYAADKWVARYTQLINLDADFLHKSGTIQQTYAKAMSIHAKKTCAAAGFYWWHNVCMVENQK